MADEIRRDAKGRKLRTGETYDKKTNRYRYSYNDINNVRRSVYSWTLTKNEPVPAGRKQKSGQSLRERESEIQKALDNQLDVMQGNMTVCELMEKYINLRSPDMREGTKRGYKTQLKFMYNNPMGHKKINQVTPSEAEAWLTELHTTYDKGYSNIKSLRGILRPAFAMAKRDGWILQNPFDFPMNRKRYGATHSRDALSKKDMRRFLDFIRTDNHFNKYFDGIYILFFTGLRISEFCGLTVDDIDFNRHVIHVKRQLLRKYNGENKPPEYYIEQPKTEKGIRDIPMLEDVEKTFKKLISNRAELKNDPIVYSEDGTESATGFFWFDKNGNLEVAQHWQNHFRNAVAKFNATYKDPLPDVTPHVCRHTFCSNCASIGMNPKTLQVIMGHSSIGVTMDVYTHLDTGDVAQQFFELYANPAFNFYPLDKAPELISLPSADPDYTEVDVDLSESPDDDEEGDYEGDDPASSENN